MLRTERLSAGYGLLRALFDVSIHAVPGETIALIGANGAGKSTLLRAIAGAIPVERESLYLDDEPVGGSPEPVQLARGIALVPEGRCLFPSLSVLENLMLAAANGRRGTWTIARVLEELPVVGPLQHRPATALSGGQQQLVAISRALVANPRYLLCDEVSLGLSPAAVGDVYRLLATARSEGMSVILVEQNIGKALAQSDRFYCIRKGRIVLDGSSRAASQVEVAQAYFGV